MNDLVTKGLLTNLGVLLLGRLGLRAGEHLPEKRHRRGAVEQAGVGLLGRDERLLQLARSQVCIHQPTVRPQVPPELLGLFIRQPASQPSRGIHRIQREGVCSWESRARNRIDWVCKRRIIGSSNTRSSIRSLYSITASLPHSLPPSLFVAILVQVRPSCYFIV